MEDHDCCHYESGDVDEVCCCLEDECVCELDVSCIADGLDAI